MRLFIHTGTRAKLIQQHKKGGGFVNAEIMVTSDLGKLGPSPEARKQWIELCEIEVQNCEMEVHQIAKVRKDRRRVYEF